MDDILRIVFAIAVLGHGLAHLVASLNLGRQLAGTPKADVPEARSPILGDRSPSASAALGLVFFVPATILFAVAAPAMAGLFLADLAWPSLLVAGALASIAGVAILAGRWPGGEARLRPLHVSLAIGFDLVILATQLVVGWPKA